MRINIKALIAGLGCSLQALWLSAQPGLIPADSTLAPGPFPFLQMQYNVLQNDSLALAGFFAKLAALEAGGRDRLVIVHIGDSHLQADLFSGWLRRGLQARFGCAGRGLVFPYRVAGTNPPGDLRSASNVSWEAKRNVFPAQPLPIGVSGITISSRDSNYVLSCGVTPNDSLDYTFDKVTLFCERGADCYNLALCKADRDIATPEYTTSSATQYHTVTRGQTLSHIAGRYGCSVADLQRWNNIRGTTIYPGQKLAVNSVTRVARPVPASTFTEYCVLPGNGSSTEPNVAILPEKVNTVWLRPRPGSDGQTHTTLFGMVLEDSKARGVLYHMIGVNGAKFDHYRQSTYFAGQLAALKPDLVIISLGTNESMDANYEDAIFRQQVEDCLSSVKEALPGTAVLFTAPNDNYARRRYVNPDAGKAAMVLREVALGHNFAFWDFYHLMGGEGSISQWKTAGLANYDKIHLIKAGYELQGDLLLRALMASYEKYKQRH